MKTEEEIKKEIKRLEKQMSEESQLFYKKMIEGEIRTLRWVLLNGVN